MKHLLSRSFPFCSRQNHSLSPALFASNFLQRRRQRLNFFGSPRLLAGSLREASGAIQRLPVFPAAALAANEASPASRRSVGASAAKGVTSPLYRRGTFHLNAPAAKPGGCHSHQHVAGSRFLRLWLRRKVGDAPGIRSSGWDLGIAGNWPKAGASRVRRLWFPNTERNTAASPIGLRSAPVPAGERRDFCGGARKRSASLLPLPASPTPTAGSTAAPETPDYFY